MRGKVIATLARSSLLGITPAYAGKSPHVRDWRTTKKDHPRLCGEKALKKRLQYKHQGSPPPMRGKVCSSNDDVQASRITPAYAGKSEHDRF